jgi:hypothetical protein
VAPRKADTKFIKCAVCERMARSAYDQAQALLATSKSTGIKASEMRPICSCCAPSAWHAAASRPLRPPPTPLQVDEAAVIDLVERSIVSWKEEGDWMTRLHLQVASGGALAVRDMRQPGECGEACKTIERAAEEVMGEHDTDVAEALFTVSARSRTRPHASWAAARGDLVYSATSPLAPPAPQGKRSFDAFKKWMCHELTRACAAAAPSVPTVRSLPARASERFCQAHAPWTLPPLHRRDSSTVPPPSPNPL